jgi:outer membrane immunogenic protein
MGFMKILAVVVVLSLCLLAGSAWAGDSTYNWSGIYGGASIGYVNASQDWTLGRPQFWGLKGDNQDFTFDQFEIGAHVGAQYQWKWLVLGGEGGIFKGPRDEQNMLSPRFPTEDQWKADIHTIAKVVAKVGYAYDRFLFYAKGGYAGAMVDTDVRSILGPSRQKTSNWQNGWTVGGGVEYAITNHILIGAEYNYIGLGSRAHKSGVTSGPFFDAKVDAAVHQVLLRISYKFEVF